MARIAPPKCLPWLTWLINRALAWRFGKPFPTVALLGHHPAYPVPYLLIASVYGTARTKLDAQTKALATQLVAQLNDCAFCTDLGQRVARDNGADVPKLRRVFEFRTRPEFTPAERAALQFAWEATQVTARVADETFAELKSFYNDRQVLELTVAVATENFYNRLTGPLEVESQGFCALPSRA